jgi:hypothetical protein
LQDLLHSRKIRFLNVLMPLAALWLRTIWHKWSPYSWQKLSTETAQQETGE